MPSRARTTLFLLFLINLLNFFDRQIIGVVAEPIRREFLLSDTALGWLSTAFTLLYAAVGLPLGRLADGSSRSRVLGWGVTVWSVCTAASGMAWNYWSLLAARMGVGFGEAACSPACNSLIGDLYPPARRARAISVFMLGLPLGILFSSLLGGAIAKAYGWRAAFYVATIPGLLLAIFVFRIKEPERGAADAGGAAVASTPTTAGGFWAPYLELWRIPTLRWIVISGALHNFNAYAVNGFLPAYLGRYHHLDIAQANRITGFTLGAVGVLALILGGIAADRSRVWRPNGRLLVGAVSAFLAAPCVYLALALESGAILPFVVLMGIGWMLFYVYYATVYASVHDVVPPRLRGTAMAVYFFWMYVLGGAFGTAILGMLSDRFARRAMAASGGTEMTEVFRAAGLHDAFFIVPALGLLLALVLFAASRTVGRDMQRLSAASA